MSFRIENLNKNHTARKWKENGDTFRFAEHLESLINLLNDRRLIPKSKINELEKDQTVGRFFGFLSELRAMVFFLSCDTHPELQGKHAFPDIILKDENIWVEVKACIENSTCYEILKLGRNPTKNELNKYIMKGIEKLLYILNEKSNKIDDHKPFILFLNTMIGGIEMHVNDIKKPIYKYLKEDSKISAVIIDDRYDLEGNKFNFAIFLNKGSDIPHTFLEKIHSSENLIKWVNDS